MKKRLKPFLICLRRHEFIELEIKNISNVLDKLQLCLGLEKFDAKKIRRQEGSNTLKKCCPFSFFPSSFLSVKFF